MTPINLRTLHAVSLASSTEETRYYLGGVLVQCRADSVTYVATDSHRLLVVRDMLADGQEPNALLGNYIIPLPICRAFKPGKGRHRAGAADVAEMTKQGEELRLQHGSAAQVFKPIDGSFPDWARVVPMQLSGQTDHVRKTGSDATGITFNPSYVSDFAKFGEIMDCGKPQLAFNSDGPAAVIFSDARVLGILMPIRASTQPELQAMFADRRDFVLGNAKAEIKEAAE